MKAMGKRKSTTVDEAKSLVENVLAAVKMGEAQGEGR